MIPTRLTVHNFMSYGDEPVTLEFTGMHIASLSGDNGNGKSALLDAITYALWGKTRASGSQASGEDDLVRLGADDMEVELEFRAGDSTYRAVRKRSRRSHTGDWQLHILDESGKWRPSGGSSMAETGRQISRILRMEYETFLNSAYIQQGRADEFTRQKPGDRKRILGDILDLRRYDRLEEMARERRSDCDLALKDVEGEVRYLESRAAEAGHAASLLADAEQASAEAGRQRDLAAQEHARLSACVSDLALWAARAKDIESRLVGEERALAASQGRAGEARERVARAEALLSERSAIEGEARLLAEQRATVEELRPLVERANAARQERASHQAAIDLARQRLLREIDQAANEARRFEERLSEVAGLDARLADLMPKLAHFEKAAHERESVRARLAEVQERFTERAAASRGLKTEIAEAEEVISLLRIPKPACPVCASDLTGGRQEAVLLRQENRLANLRQRLTEVNHEGAQLKRERDSLQASVDVLDEQMRSEAALRAQRTELLSARDRLAEDNRGSESVAALLDELRCRLAAGDYAHEHRRALQTVEEELERLSTTAERHANAASIVRELTSRHVERRFAEMQQAEKERALASAEQESLDAEAAAKARLVEELREGLAATRDQSAGLDAARDSVRLAAEDLHRATEAAQSAISQVARYRQTSEDCAKAQAQLKERLAVRDRLARDKQAYADLAAAFGKRGLQAHIIDNALPEVEEEANRLLSRLTDNAMHITLSTLRQARAGSGQIETLDISITDEAGTRPYEMYSGGEAFRVNFAIRIALSRLLARRAGADLQTLILDEGFGTQDAKGRERLVEAIEAVKDEFALIIVISHVDELKDAFPTRIEVTKTSAGSQIALIA